MSLSPRRQIQRVRGVSVSADLVAQWRESLHDGVYAVPGFLLVPANGSRARFVGYRPGVEVRWQIDRHAYLQADYGVLCQQRAETGPDLVAILLARRRKRAIAEGREPEPDRPPERFPAR